MFKIGAGPAPIPQHALTAERLTQAIQVVATDETMRERTRRIGEQVRSEDGVTQAIEIIAQQLHGS